MADRDTNGMIAQNWKAPDIKAIQSESIKSANNNIELFNGIKNIVSAAVTTLYGKSTDDKYKYLVDMIMMRVRAATQKISSKNNDQIISDITKNINEIINSEDLITKLSTSIQTDLTNSNGTIIVSENTWSKLIQSILDTLKNNTNIDNVETATEVQTTDTKEAEEKTDTAVTSELPITRSEFQERIDSINVCITKMLDIISGHWKIIKSVSQSVSGGSNSKNTLTSKQYKSFINIINRELSYTRLIIDQIGTDTSIKLNKVLDGLIDIQKTLNKKKPNKLMQALMILGLIGGVVIAFFWDKISAKLKEWFGTSNIAMLIFKLLGKIPWLDMINGLGKLLWKLVKWCWDNIIVTTFNHVVHRFKQAWEVLCNWTKDVWSWITGKTKEVEERQDEKEQQAEEKTELSLNDAMNTLNSNMEGNTADLMKSCNKTLNEQEQIINDTTSDVTKSTDEINNTVNSSMTTITEETDNTTKNLEENVMPSLETDIENTTNNQVDNLDKKSEAQINAAESKLDEQLNKIDETIKENGAPTNVPKETLDKMQRDAESDGNVDTKISQPVKTPSNVTVQTEKEQGKNVNLYSKTDDIKEVNKNLETIEGFNKSEPQTIDVNGNPTKAELEQTLIVTGPDGQKLNATAINKKMADFNTVLDILIKTDEHFDENNKLLKSIKDNVKDYFTTLNSCVKNISANGTTVTKQTEQSTKHDNDDYKQQQQPSMIFMTPTSNNSLITGAGYEDM